MMGKKDYSERSQVQIASLDDLVPSGHLVRKLEVNENRDPPIRVWHPFHAQNNQRD